mgnify:CR=1 FL=1
MFGMWSLLGQVAPTATVRAPARTSLCYLIDAEVANAVLRSGGGIAFVAGASAAASRRSTRLGEEVDLVRYQQVGALVRRTPVTCEPETPVADAAGLMARERVSSLLVPNASGGGVGILTDRDLRTRVVAERRSGETPVREVMTPRAETVPPETMVGEVLLRMLEGGFHHFPIAAADGSVLGVVTRHRPDGDRPRLAVRAQELDRARARSRGGRDRGRRAPRVVSTLVSASADPVDVGHVIAFAIDAATRRLLELGMAEHGEPSFPWAWLALGARPVRSRRSEPTRTTRSRSRATPTPRTRRWPRSPSSSPPGSRPPGSPDARAT